MKLGLGLGLQYKNKAVGSSGATGILDNYTGAAFAAAPDVLIYSAHSVTDNIVGSTTNGGTDAYTVTVRRNSDDALRSFNYTEVSDGTLITWVGAGNDGFVRQLWDQSGNNNHATQSTAANQPKIVDAGSLVVENGKAALDFDGVNDRLVFSQISFSQMALFIVGRGFSNSGNQICQTNNSNSTLSINNSVVSFNQFSGGLNFTTESTINWMLSLHRDSANSMNCFINSQASSSNPIVNSSAFSPNSINGRASFSFTRFGLSSCVFYNSDQLPNRTAIETIINTTYNNIY